MRPTFLFLAGSALAWAVSGISQAQQAATCMNQYADAEGATAASLIGGGFEIRAAVPGGLWLQKSKETFYCNVGRPSDNQKILCWTLQAPVKGGSCQ